ncbi:MAG: chalcone isomerase family protein [Gallionella sp.]
MKKILLLICCVFLSWNACALEVSGVKLADSIHLGSHDLVLNGAGLRTKFFFKVYVAALYLGEKTHVAEVALNQSGEKRVALYIKRELSDEQMLHSFNEVMAANHTAAEMQAMEPQLKELTEIFHAVKSVREGDVVFLDYLPDSGTKIIVNGVPRGNIAGAVFNRALFKIWLGDRPAQPNLKQKMLGLQ